MQPILSIIIPAFNAGKYIEYAVNSIFDGIGNEVEVLVIDDGSTDNTCQVCDKIADNRLRIFKQDNQGAPVARNNGLKKSNGEYVMFFDADDFFEKGAIKSIISEIQLQKHDCYVGNFYRFNGVESKLEYKTLNYIDSMYDLYMFTPSPASKVFRKEILLEKRIFFEKLKMAQDLNFYLKFLGITQDIKVIDYPFFHYRYVEGSISHVVDERILDIGNSIQYALDYYQTNNVDGINIGYAALTGVKHTNYQLAKIIKLDDYEKAKYLYEQIIQIWDRFYHQASIPFNLKFYVKKWIDAVIQHYYRHQVKRHINKLYI